MKGATEERRKNAECVLVFNDGSGIWEIMCAEWCWLSGEREGAGDLLRLQPRKPWRPRRDGGNRQPVCAHKHTCMHTGSTAVFGQSTLVRDLLSRGPPWFCMHYLLLFFLSVRSIYPPYYLKIQISSSLGWSQIMFPEGAGSLVNSPVLQT